MSVTRNLNLGPSQMRARRRRIFFVRFLIILFFLLIIVLGLAILSGHKKVTIQTIIVSGNAAVSSDEILTIANRDMAGRYWYLFARNNFLIFPRFQIAESILREYKTVKEVDISWDGWQKISISITERKPHSVWCGEKISTNSLTEQCYFIDKAGYIYGEAPTFSGSMFVKGYSVLADPANPAGQNYLPADKYERIFNLISLLDQKAVKVISVSSDGFDYRFGLDTGPEIIFNDKQKFESSFGNLFTAMETGDLDLIKDAMTIKYIDLRFDNKIVVGKNEAK